MTVTPTKSGAGSHLTFFGGKQLAQFARSSHFLPSMDTPSVEVDDGGVSDFY
jgi:hypothetical protein